MRDDQHPRRRLRLFVRENNPHRRSHPKFAEERILGRGHNQPAQRIRRDFFHLRHQRNHLCSRGWLDALRAEFRRHLG